MLLRARPRLAQKSQQRALVHFMGNALMEPAAGNLSGGVRTGQGPARPLPSHKLHQGQITCDFDALCDSDRRIRMSKSHEAENSHVNLALACRLPPAVAGR